MANLIDTSSPRKVARIAGLLYLIYIVTSIFADLFGHFVFGDATAIANNIMANGGLFRTGFIIALFSAAFFLLAAWALYVLLKPVNKNIALLFLLLNLAGVVVQCISILSLFASSLLLSGADYMKIFQVNQLKALAILFINLFKNGYMIAQIFYGIWLLPLGYLVYQSRFLPKTLGILLIIDCFAVLIWFFQFFLFPDYKIITYPFLVESFIAEVGLTLWLLVKGAKVKLD